MAGSDELTEPIELSIEHGLWNRYFSVAPLVIVGSLNDDGTHNLAPKHMAMPMGYGGFFGFVCTPRHATYGNAIDTGVFTVSYPRPAQLVEVGQSAAPRTPDGEKYGLTMLDTFPARDVEGVLVRGAAVFLECALEHLVEPLGEHGLVIGRVVAAAADPDVVRDPDRDDADLISREPLLAYISPGRIAEIARTQAFPFPAGFAW
jgi:flavin reductase (DIM6/NTAB) family NADH-FMN oxidoreductase RutF